MRGGMGEGGMEEGMVEMKVEKWQSIRKGGTVQLSGKKNLSSLTAQAYQTAPWGLEAMS